MGRRKARCDEKEALVVLAVFLAFFGVLWSMKPGDRQEAIRFLLICAGAYVVVTRVLPLVFVGAVWVLSSAATLCTVLGIVVLVHIVLAVRRDFKENRAIRAGSVEAFDRRVESLMSTFAYTREKAIKATCEIRDGEMPGVKLARRRRSATFID